jgi:hypothetical protein
MIQGQVVNAGGRPVPDARVMVLAGPGSFTDTALLTDDEGRFTLGLPDGDYELGVQADGYEAARIAVPPQAGRTATVRVQLTHLG